MEVKFSIVIPVFNKWNFTKSCLHDLAQLPLDHEIIIVDNGSSDETEPEIRKMDVSNLRYYRNPINMGFAVACNQGFGESKGVNIMFLNNDIRVKSNHTDWTNTILGAIKEDTLVGPTAGMVDSAHNFQFLYETQDPQKAKNYMSGWCLSASRDTWNKLEIKRPPCLIYDRQPPPQIFSEEFGLAYFEDTDLSFRAKRMKMNFKMVEIPVVHFGKVSSGQINTSALYSKARQIFINKWGNK